MVVGRGQPRVSVAQLTTDRDSGKGKQSGRVLTAVSGPRVRDAGGPDPESGLTSERVCKEAAFAIAESACH